MSVNICCLVLIIQSSSNFIWDYVNWCYKSQDLIDFNITCTHLTLMERGMRFTKRTEIFLILKYTKCAKLNRCLTAIFQNVIIAVTYDVKL